MKTEQEQIKEMSCILTMLINCGGGCMAQYCHLVDNYAKKLIEAGYGDVSEYKAEIKRLKAEIKRLKAEFKQLEVNAEILASGVRDLNHENYELTKKVKQAKIDVLNKLKDSYGLYYLSAFGVKERMLADILNPMIEELKK